MSEVMEDVREIQTLIAKDAIRDVMSRYSQGIDRCDLERLKSVYWPDAVDDHGVFCGNAWEFAEFVIPALREMRRTMHALANMHIEVLDDHRAIAESYVIAYHEADGEDGPVEMIVGGRYFDVFEKRGREWRILERKYVMDWNQNGPSTANWTTGLYENLTTHGSRAPDDLWYAWRDARVKA